MVTALFHFDGNGVGGRHNIVVLRGTFYSDLVCSLAQALQCPRKTFLILIVHIHMDMRLLGALGQLIFQIKTVADLISILGRGDDYLRPSLDWRSTWFILCDDRCHAETAQQRNP